MQPSNHLLPRLAFCLFALSGWSAAAPFTVWIGTFGKGEQAGIYRAALDSETGKLSAPEQAGHLEGAGFLALVPGGRHIVSTASGPLPEGGKGGLVASWKRLPGGKLELLGTQSSGGGICHVSVAAAGRTVLAANYGGGSVASFALDAGGKLSPRVSLLSHEGKGPNPQRQTAPHAHAFVPLPGAHFAAAPDLGIDQVVVYKVDPGSSELTRHGSAATPPGSGPRHLAVHPDGKAAYVVGELDQSVTVFDWQADTGKLVQRQVAPSRPDGMGPENLTSAEIRARADGKFVYASTRDLGTEKRDFLTVFKVHPDHTLEPVQHVPAVVGFPRNFTLTPDGKWLLAGGEKSNDIQVFSVAADTGKLTPVGLPVACPSPVCFVVE